MLPLLKISQYESVTSVIFLCSHKHRSGLPIAVYELMKTQLKWRVLMISFTFLLHNSTVQSLPLIKMLAITPLPVVKGMKELDRKLFEQTISVPCLKFKSSSSVILNQLMKKYFLKLNNFKAIRPAGDDSREIFLNPQMVSRFSDFPIDVKKQLGELGVDESCLHQCPLQLTYANWTLDDVLTAILPEGVETASSYSVIGHIVHVNLREHLLDYKHVIGQVLLDKIKNVKTVVNKLDTIDNTFRVFKMEVLAGKADFITEVKENYSRFRFDFSAVYWNPRLSTEHVRIANKLNPGNVLYDVFAGVGPFSIPVARKKCTVLANDLNPESFKWLQHNAKLNKVDHLIKTYNKDGADFIRGEVRQHLLEKGGQQKSHLVMNLPSIAPSFLPAFKQMFSPDELKDIKMLPLAHVYCFVKGEGDPKEMAKALIEEELKCCISDDIDEIFHVRNVAPSKEMMRVSFQLTEKVLLGGKRKLESNYDGIELKKNK